MTELQEQIDIWQDLIKLATPSRALDERKCEEVQEVPAPAQLRQLSSLNDEMQSAVSGDQFDALSLDDSGSDVINERDAGSVRG